MRRCPTPAEKKLWNLYLKSFRVRVLRQRPIDHFIVDFYCAALQLVIEVDGDVHESEQAQVYDEGRSKIFAQLWFASGSGDEYGGVGRV